MALLVAERAVIQKFLIKFIFECGTQLRNFYS